MEDTPNFWPSKLMCDQPGMGSCCDNPLRTADDSFAGLQGFDFKPVYCEGLAGFAGLWMHWVDAALKMPGTLFVSAR